MKLSLEQCAAVDAFDAARRDRRRPQIVIAGHAGTGKTTIIESMVARASSDSDVIVCTPTGKAAHVLRSKGVDAITVHSLLYYPRPVGAQLAFVDNGSEMPDVVIVDEASMLDQRIYDDLRARVPFVAYVGDHGQLEPISNDPGFMRSPDVCLEKIHRQVAGSAILKFAHRVRNGQAPITCGVEAQVVLKAPPGVENFDVILCALNKTRVSLNAWVRRKRKFSGQLPSPGEQVICLRNSKENRVWNGMTGVVRDITATSRACQISVDTDDGPRLNIPFVPRQFGLSTTLDDKYLMRKGAPTLWDFGYCLTVHKAQGSEWDRVAVFDEVPSNWSVERWRYTAATRAANGLLWITK